MTDAVETNLSRKPKQLSADAGYCSNDERLSASAVAEATSRDKNVFASTAIPSINNPTAIIWTGSSRRPRIH
jgi:hypothetical protein